MENFIRFLALSILVSMCYARERAAHVADSKFATKQGQYGFVVSIELKDTLSFPLCIGSLLSPSIVLTAAFCLGTNWGSIVKELQVTAGSLYLRPTNCSSVEKRKVLRQVIHPKYHQQYPYNDIAVLLLGPPFDFKKNPNINAISLATKDFEVGKQCRSLAWGSQENFKVNQTNIPLKAIPVHLYDRKSCMFAFQFLIKPGQACSERPPLFSSLCPVDIGSPLICGKFLVGIATRVHDCQDIKQPNVYTLVSHYIRFIERAIVPMSIEKGSRLKPKWRMCLTANIVTNLFMLSLGSS
ncbi:trypsin-like [Hermetia illucens]|uniref:trypsin-like n=1 Tax=Hermetia illucens TaxID=343691 RepID=UPI0018CC0C2D|nr:trypsin-like [Hermetia illucens]